MALLAETKAKDPSQQAYSPNEAAYALGVSTWTIRKEIKKGRLLARKLGARTVIIKEDLDRYLRSLPHASGKARA